MRNRDGGFTLLEVLIAVAIVADPRRARLSRARRDGAKRIATLPRRRRGGAHWICSSRASKAICARPSRAARAWVTRASPRGSARSTTPMQRRARVFSRRARVQPRARQRRAAHRVPLARRRSRSAVLVELRSRTRHAEPSAYPLLSDVARFRLAYLGKNGAWVANWPVTGDADVPRAARVELMLANGESIERWMALR